MTYSEGADFLLLYDMDQRGLYTFNLAEELSDPQNKQIWTPASTPDENHFSGLKGANHVAAMVWREDYSETEYVYLLGEGSQDALRQGLINGQGYTYLYQYYKNCIGCVYKAMVSSKEYLAVLSEDSDHKFKVEIFVGHHSANTNLYASITTDVKYTSMIIKSTYDIYVGVDSHY